jgi:uncharacterized protein involved in exopolysaccharide biosynthesis
MRREISILPDESLREMPLVRLQSSRTNWTLRDLATILFRRKWMMIGMFTMIAMATLAAAFLMPHRYQSRMKILVKNARADVVITPEQTNSSNGGGEVTETQINSEIELLNSKDLLEDVARKSGLDQHETASFWSKGVPPVERSIRRLERDLAITPVKKSDIIEVSYTAGSPELATAVLQNLSNLYLEKHLKLHRPPGTYEFFQAQANQYGGQLREREAGMLAFQQRNDLVSLDQEKQLNLQKMADAQSRYMEAVTAVNEATKRIAKLREQLATTAPRVVTQSRALPNQYSVERLSTMLVELQNRRTQLLTKFQPADRFVKEVDQQIKDTSAALDKAMKMTNVEQSSDLNPLRQTLETELARASQELAGQQARRDEQARQVAQYQALLTHLEQSTNEHAALERQVKEAADNYQLYSKKQEESRIADELDQKKITNVSIAEAPVMQRQAVWPNRPLILSLGIFLAFFVSIASVLATELLRDTVHTPRELELFAGVPVIATIPEEGPSLAARAHASTDEGEEDTTALPAVSAWRSKRLPERAAQ